MNRQFSTYMLLLILFSYNGTAQQSADFSVIAYYTGDAKKIDQYDVGKLTHIIFSCCHLKDGRLHVDDARDTATIERLVRLKSDYPKLNVMLSLGGWGGCEYCSDVFSTQEGRSLHKKSRPNIFWDGFCLCVFATVC